MSYKNITHTQRVLFFQVAVTAFLVFGCKANPNCFDNFNTRKYVSSSSNTAVLQKKMRDIRVKITLSGPLPQEPRLNFWRVYRSSKEVMKKMGFRVKNEQFVSSFEGHWAAVTYQRGGERIYFYTFQNQNGYHNHSLSVSRKKGPLNQKSYLKYKNCLLLKAKDEFYGRAKFTLIQGKQSSKYN